MAAGFRCVMVFFGTMTVGNVLWGELANLAGLLLTHFVAAAGALLAIPLTRRWKLRTAAGMDLSPSMHWPSSGHHERCANRISGPVMAFLPLGEPLLHLPATISSTTLVFGSPTLHPKNLHSFASCGSPVLSLRGLGRSADFSESGHAPTQDTALRHRSFSRRAIGVRCRSASSQRRIERLSREVQAVFQ